MPYVQHYIKTYGVRKCEANAIVPYPDLAKGLVENSIQNYLGKDAVNRFKKKTNEVAKIIQNFRIKTGIDETLRNALDLIEGEE